MTSVQFLSSVQGHQVARVKEIAEKLKAREPSVSVEVVDGERNVEMLKKHKIQFGPAVVIDGRLEFVGVPRLTHLIGRVVIGKKRELLGLPPGAQYEVETISKDAPVVPLVAHPMAAPAPKEPARPPKPAAAAPAPVAPPKSAPTGPATPPTPAPAPAAKPADEAQKSKEKPPAAQK